MKGAESFFDTSVLFYLLGADAAKAARAENLLAGGGAISVQVLNEFAAAAIRKRCLSVREIREVLGTIRQVCRAAPLTHEDHELALQITERHRFNFFDSLIVASAIHAACKILYSEDLQHGQRIGGLQVVNPFKDL